MIDRPHRQHVLELAESALDLGQFLVHRHRVEDAQSLLAGRDHIFSFDPLLTPQARLALGEAPAPRWMSQSK